MLRLGINGIAVFGRPSYLRPGLLRQLTTSDLSSRIQYNFRDESLGSRALDHPIACASKTNHHCRLEYVGDAVMCLLVRDALLERVPAASSGELTPLNDNLSRNEFLADLAKEIGLQVHIEEACAKAGITATSEAMDGALADTFEAVIGAVYTDGGLAEARRVFLGVLGDIDRRLLQSVYHDVKKILMNAAIQLNSNYRIKYVFRQISAPGTGCEASVECTAMLIDSGTGCIVMVPLPSPSLSNGRSIPGAAA